MADTISGFQIDLSEGRHVFVAEADGCFCIRFRNAEGNETRLRLSKEAGDALRYLLQPVKQSSEVVTRWLAYMTEAKQTEGQQVAWQVVKLDEAPAEPQP